MVGSLVVCGIPVWAAKQDATQAVSKSKAPTVEPGATQMALRVYYLAADGYQAQNQPDQALAIYEAAAKMFPEHEDVLVRLRAHHGGAGDLGGG